MLQKLILNLCINQGILINFNLSKNDTLLNRQEFLILERADMTVQYEEREGSRRAAEWKERGLVPASQLYKSTLPLVKIE